MATGVATEVGDTVAVLPEIATAIGLEGAGRWEVWLIFVKTSRTSARVEHEKVVIKFKHKMKTHPSTDWPARPAWPSNARRSSCSSRRSLYMRRSSAMECFSSTT